MDLLILAQAETEHKRALAEAQLDVQIAEAELAPAKMELPGLAAAEAALTAAQAELQELLAGPDDLEVQARPGESVIDRAGVILMADARAVEVYTEVIEGVWPLPGPASGAAPPYRGAAV